MSEWAETLHDEADIILYLVNAKQVNQQRIRRDLEKLESWSKARALQPKLVVIVTHNRRVLLPVLCRLQQST
jgi:hypothetical protein